MYTHTCIHIASWHSSLCWLYGTNEIFSQKSSLDLLSEYRDLRLDLGHIVLYWVCFVQCPSPKEENVNVHWYFMQNWNWNSDGTWRKVEDLLCCGLKAEYLGFKMNCPSSSKFRSFPNNPCKMGKAVEFFEFNLL